MKYLVHVDFEKCQEPIGMWYDIQEQKLKEKYLLHFIETTF